MPISSSRLHTSPTCSFTVLCEPLKTRTPLFLAIVQRFSNVQYVLLTWRKVNTGKCHGDCTNRHQACARQVPAFYLFAVGCGSCNVPINNLSRNARDGVVMLVFFWPPEANQRLSCFIVRAISLLVSFMCKPWSSRWYSIGVTGTMW